MDVSPVEPPGEDIRVDTTPQGFESTFIQRMDDRVEEKTGEKNVEDGIPQVAKINQELPKDVMPIEPSETGVVLERMGEHAGEKEVENVEPQTVVILEGKGGDTTQGDKQTEVRVKVELVDTCVDDPSRTTPTTRPVEEVTVKQEFIEQCARRVPPLKERYQYQFNELMQLKIDNLRLRKRVLHLQKGARRYMRKIAILKTGTSPSAAQVRDNPTMSPAVQTVLCPYNTSHSPITIAIVSLIVIVVPLLSPYCYYCAT